jgi:hypothetical protein
MSIDSIKPVKVAGELYWSNWMKEYNKKFNEANDKYECTLGQLSDAACAKLEELGIKLKDKDTMGKYIVGKSKFLFEPVDEEGNPVDISKIGNGTKCYALVSSYRHKMSAKFGAAPSIKKLVITELKVYSPSGSDEGSPEEQETADDIL